MQFDDIIAKLPDCPYLARYCCKVGGKKGERCPDTVLSGKWYVCPHSVYKPYYHRLLNKQSAQGGGAQLTGRERYGLTGALDRRHEG